MKTEQEIKNELILIKSQLDQYKYRDLEDEQKAANINGLLDRRKAFEWLLRNYKELEWVLRNTDERL